MAETVPYPNWDGWWRASPYVASLAAGAFAGMSAEAVLFPLDCLKTRVQSQQGFFQAGGFRGIYRGCGTAIAGSVPASAIFFSTYEFFKNGLVSPEAAKREGQGFDDTSSTQLSVVCIASVFGELAASCIRVPADIVKQRLQAGYRSSFSLPMTSSIFLASYQATAMRDVMHSSLQYPIYESLKHLVVVQRAGQAGAQDSRLPAWVAAVCGSVAGVISAFLTTPFDLLKTRLNLRQPDSSGGNPRAAPWSRAVALTAEEIREIYSSKGFAGFYVGAGFRALWMGLGGFVFLGSFEFAKDRLSRPTVDRMDFDLSSCLKEARQSAATQQAPKEALARSAPSSGEQPHVEPSPSVSFAAGLVAGVAVDVPLHPVDTLKTRLQARQGFTASGGFRSLWSGLIPVLVMSVPGSAVFFVVYEEMQHLLECHAPAIFGSDRSRPSQLGNIWRDAVSASLADVSACCVRVPCEVVKQRMQTQSSSSMQSSVLGTVRSVNVEGFRGFFAGFGATVIREVPFALIQMPLFEELKLRHPWTPEARRRGDTAVQGLIGMTSGGLAGAIAGAVTTPIDAAKTRIMLTAERVERRGLLETLGKMHAESGLRGLVSGITPRTLQCGAGGALWLGAFEWSKLLLCGGASKEVF